MDIVIIGNGIAGVTAARHIRKRDADSRIILISKESKYFFSRTALMYIYMGHMKLEHTQPYENWFWEKNRIELIQDTVTKVDFDLQQLFLKNQKLTYDQLIIATGSKPNKFGWPGQDAKGVQGLYSLQDLESLEADTPKINHAVVVGGGLIGVELVEMLRSRDISVTFLVREKTFWNKILSKQEGEMIAKHMVNDHHVDLRLGYNLQEIKTDSSGHASSIIIKETGEELECQFVGLTAGVSPNIDFLKDSGLEIDKGILVDEFLSTNKTNVFAIGDCAQVKNPNEGRRPLEPVWYVGRMMGETVANTVCGIPTKYNPGIWFNSAKFFDIEYQNYGNIPATPEENQEHFYWQHPTEYIALRVVFDKNTKQLLGVNNFGFRLRHPLFDKWIERGEDVCSVMAQLRDANFDPEFYKKHEEDIVKAFNDKYGFDVKLKKKSWSNILNLITP